MQPVSSRGRSPEAGSTPARPTDVEYGWRCRPCGWQTFDLKVMHDEVNWANPDGSVSLVCPQCGAEGDFIDATRQRA